ncbi:MULTISPECIES: GNAT family N-acetyltransferase [Streptomyces]|uniref:N-acetyltransferase n=1 Tax=Streptomyces tsukubensis (strain DSM 42081 / NBRC 108919 / NRRL 18488 / 9993) TaxID=1114943 RepID=A0A7G3UH89_STRT9|nr:MULTISPECIES: GNAT family protein [Streptomyces]AZK95174.1 GNAT family N-acetyltransferase [Streptomyces tsukubensis]MYS65932.1 GNAT family N-acetyltransferase [Streptomyces sp. SID5473]QKM68765.1 N-acetyltransferase [Streptomyces tsukubensis NRRL18488]TAI43570.1 N-acetyltransferase [Streptomyces tsukubensis]
MEDLVTERLVLHPLTPEEAGQLAEGVPFPGAAWAPGYPMTDDRSAARRFLDTRTRATAGRPHPGAFEIRLRSDGRAIGGVDFHGPADSTGSVTVGYGLIPSARGRGYASEALRAVLAHARALGITRVKGDADHNNTPSHHVMTAAGMHLTGEDHRVRYYETAWHRTGPDTPG